MRGLREAWLSGRHGLDMHRAGQTAQRPSSRRGKGQAGQGILEVAITFPLLALDGPGHWGGGVDVLGPVGERHRLRRGGAPFRLPIRRLHQSYGGLWPLLGGHDRHRRRGRGGLHRATRRLWSIRSTRSVRVSAWQGATFTSPAVSAGYTFKSGTFSRMMQFFGGPPSPWE